MSLTPSHVLTGFHVLLLFPYLGNKLLPGAEPAAHCYCGFQFGYFSGQLGDGATMYLGEVSFRLFCYPCFLLKLLLKVLSIRHLFQQMSLKNSSFGQSPYLVNKERM